MANPIRGISEVIKLDPAKGYSPDMLVWKFPEEDFNATSQLIVDETHEAILVINGNAADLFGPGRRTLSVPNIPLARKLIEIPTDDKSPFPCKVFFINKVHQMDLLWGTFGAITLEDPLYDIFMHVMANGSMSVTVEDTRKFMLKLVGFRDKFDPESLIQKFRGIISSHVKDCISKIMINGMLSYFMINANVFELSGVIKERLDSIFDEYGIMIQYFNIETVDVPKEDYEAVTKAKERRSGNGRHIGMSIAEVTAIPFYELYDKDTEHANNMNQVLFTQLVSAFHRKSEENFAALELLWQSVAVDNQTYKAQVKLYVVVRKIGADGSTVKASVDNMMQSIKNDLEDKNFTISVLYSAEELDEYEQSLGQISTEKTLSVAKREKSVANAMSANGCMYYNDVLYPDENMNTVSISNALTQYPNSAISMQIIPAAYTVQEIYAVEESKNFLNHYVSNIRYTQGIRVDANTQMIVDAYDYYSNANNEQLFYYNFVIYSSLNNAVDLANKLINAAEDQRGHHHLCAL